MLLTTLPLSVTSQSDNKTTVSPVVAAVIAASIVLYGAVKFPFCALASVAVVL